MIARVIPMPERIARRVRIDPETGCHTWTGVLHQGYGRIHIREGGMQFTHRIAYELRHGPIPDGLQLDHLCRNRACCNPDHLEPVTRKENLARGESPSAKYARRTHCGQGHEYTPENTYYVKGGTTRLCKTCAIRKAVEWQRKRRDSSPAPLDREEARRRLTGGRE